MDNHEIRVIVERVIKRKLIQWGLVATYWLTMIAAAAASGILIGYVLAVYATGYHGTVGVKLPTNTTIICGDVPLTERLFRNTVCPERTVSSLTYYDIATVDAYIDRVKYVRQVDISMGLIISLCAIAAVLLYKANDRLEMMSYMY